MKGEDAIEQDRLHLVSAADADRLEQESEHPQAGEGPAGPPAADDEDFNWCGGNDAVIIREQRAIAVYVNPFGQAVIRQERAWDDEDDVYICIDHANLPEAIAALRAIADHPRQGERGEK